MKNRSVIEMAASRALARNLTPEQAGLLKLVLANDNMRGDFLNQIDFEHGHKIAQKDEDNLKLIAALDYALGRSTTVPHTVADEIKEHWDYFTNLEKQDVIEKIESAVSKNRAGHDVDVRKWQEVLDHADLASAPRM